jgi:hypothetical protein
MLTATQVQTQDEVAAGVSRSEPVGRAQRNASGRDAGITPGVADLPDPVKELLPDGVVDELLAGAQGEQEIVSPWGFAFAADEAAGGARDGGRAHRPPGL